MFLIRYLAVLVWLLPVPSLHISTRVMCQHLPSVGEHDSLGTPVPAALQSKNRNPDLMIPPAVVPLLDFDQVPIQNAIAALFRPFNVNVWISPDVGGVVTAYLANVQLEDAFCFLIKENRLRYTCEDNIIKIYPAAEAQIYSTAVNFENGLLSLDFQAVPLQLGITAIIKATGSNIVVEQGSREH